MRRLFLQRRLAEVKCECWRVENNRRAEVLREEQVVRDIDDNEEATGRLASLTDDPQPEPPGSRSRNHQEYPYPDKPERARYNHGTVRYGGKYQVHYIRCSNPEMVKRTRDHSTSLTNPTTPTSISLCGMCALLQKPFYIQQTHIRVLIRGKWMLSYRLQIFNF
jgi:hypothetical protein